MCLSWYMNSVQDFIKILRNLVLPNTKLRGHRGKNRSWRDKVGRFWPLPTLLCLASWAWRFATCDILPACLIVSVSLILADARHFVAPFRAFLWTANGRWIGCSLLHSSPVNRLCLGYLAGSFYLLHVRRAPHSISLPSYDETEIKSDRRYPWCNNEPLPSVIETVMHQGRRTRTGDLSCLSWATYSFDIKKDYQNRSQRVFLSTVLISNRLRRITLFSQTLFPFIAFRHRSRDADYKTFAKWMMRWMMIKFVCGNAFQKARIKKMKNTGKYARLLSYLHLKQCPCASQQIRSVGVNSRHE